MFPEKFTFQALQTRLPTRRTLPQAVQSRLGSENDLCETHKQDRTVKMTSDDRADETPQRK